MQCLRKEECTKHRRAGRETAKQQATRDRRDGDHWSLLTHWMRIGSLYIECGGLMALHHVPLAVRAGLLHGHTATAMLPGRRKPAALWLIRRRVIPWLTWSEPAMQVWGRIRIAEATSLSVSRPPIGLVARRGPARSLAFRHAGGISTAFSHGAAFRHGTRQPNARN